MPLASIIIPSYNGKHLLAKHLPRVVEASDSEVEIIVVDDASTDGSMEFVNQNFKNIKVVRLTSNKRFAGACNAGVKHATSKIVVLLNNDVSPKPSFLKPLLSHFRDANVFAVGCKEIDLNGNISGRSCGSFERGFLTHYRCPDQSAGGTLWASGGSGAFRKSYWHRLEGMDITFRPAYEEDRDICYRALKRGWKVIFEPLSVVEHQHETTNRKVLGEWKIQSASYKNQFLLVWKNITDTKLLLNHLFWLPYHLVFTTIRSRGLFLLGLLWALVQLPQTLPLRWMERRYSIYTDMQVLNQFSKSHK